MNPEERKKFDEECAQLRTDLAGFLKEPETKLISLILAIKQEEQQGRIKKQTLITMAEYMATHTQTFHYTKEEQAAALQILAKYHMAALADRMKGKTRIQKEKAKAWEYRCSNCGAIITSEESKKTGLGSVCRKKLSAKTKTSKQEETEKT